MITIRTKQDAATLALKIKSSIRDNNIPSWMVDQDGDMTLSSTLWRNKAWMHIETRMPHRNELQVSIIGQANLYMTNEIFAVYHSRFAEMLLTYFDDDIDRIELSSALIAQVDKCLNLDLALGR